MTYIVRPKGILTTPKQLADDLGWQTRFYPNKRRKRLYRYDRDFFMTAVHPEDVRNAPNGYAELYHFLSRDKYGQRKALAQSGLPTPITVGSHGQAREQFGERTDGRYVVRPLRHSGGRGYRVTSDPEDFVERQEYLTELYPKKREYRVIFVYGNPLISLRKKPNGEATQEEPWGHVNSTFQTIGDVAGSKLAATDFYWRMAHNSLVRSAHILAADILYNGKHAEPWVILELNACPGLQIEANRAKVAEAIQARRAV